MDAMRSPTLSAREFAEGYARRAGYSLQEFAAKFGHRRVVRLCDCGSPMCQGWGMTPPSDDVSDELEIWTEPAIPLADLLDQR